MNNFKLGAERDFKKDYEKFRQAAKIFFEKHKSFKEAVQEKINWINELSDTTNTFHDDLMYHIEDVCVFNDKVNDCIEELNKLPDYPENIH